MGNGQYAQKKTCGIKQHVKIDNIFEEPNLICGKPAVGEKINSTRYIYLNRNIEILYMYFIGLLIILGKKAKVNNKLMNDKRYYHLYVFGL